MVTALELVTIVHVEYSYPWQGIKTHRTLNFKLILNNNIIFQVLHGYMVESLSELVSC